MLFLVNLELVIEDYFYFIHKPKLELIFLNGCFLNILLNLLLLYILIFCYCMIYDYFGIFSFWITIVYNLLSQYLQHVNDFSYLLYKHDPKLLK